MKVKVPLALLLLLAAAIGYLLGTEKGREQRDVILVKVGRKQPDTAVPDTVEVAPDESADSSS